MDTPISRCIIARAVAIVVITACLGFPRDASCAPSCTTDGTSGATTCFFGSSGTWTPPLYADVFTVNMWGGGGGGAGYYCSIYGEQIAWNGFPGGLISNRTYNATGLSDPAFSVTIGSGGTGGSTCTTLGTSGGSTVVALYEASANGTDVLVQTATAGGGSGSAPPLGPSVTAAYSGAPASNSGAGGAGVSYTQCGMLVCYGDGATTCICPAGSSGTRGGVYISFAVAGNSTGAQGVFTPFPSPSASSSPSASRSPAPTPSASPSSVVPTGVHSSSSRILSPLTALLSSWDRIDSSDE